MKKTLNDQLTDATVKLKKKGYTIQNISAPFGTASNTALKKELLGALHEFLKKLNKKKSSLRNMTGTTL